MKISRREASKRAFILEKNLTDAQLGQIEVELDIVATLIEKRKKGLKELNKLYLRDNKLMEEVRNIDKEIKKIIKKINSKLAL